jgi:hypothetical protein
MFPDVADWYDEVERWEERLRNTKRHESPSRVDDVDAAALDAEAMPFEEWVTCWQVDPDTGQLVMVG